MGVGIFVGLGAGVTIDAVAVGVGSGKDEFEGLCAQLKASVSNSAARTSAPDLFEFLNKSVR